MDRRSLLKLFAYPSMLSFFGCGQASENQGSEIGCANSAGKKEFTVCSDYAVKSSPPNLNFLKLQPIADLKIGLIGVGQRGSKHLDILSKFEFITITAICDLRQEVLSSANEKLKKNSLPHATTYSEGGASYLDMLNREKLDLVIISTPWDSHAKIAIDSMSAGVHVAVEVPAALTVDECWKIISASETYSKHFIMLENVNYSRNEMMVLNAVRKGIIGTPVHAECAYLHDLRHNLLRPDRNFPPNWRAQHHLTRNGNLYPTHGLGPVANYLDINRGNRFVSICSMSSKSTSLNEYAKENYPDSLGMEDFVCGDYNSSIIKTERGETIYLSFSTSTPRPYSRINMIQGSKGVFEGFPERYYLDSSQSHKWLEMQELYAQLEHPIWSHWLTELRSKYSDASHEGADSVMWYKVLTDLIEGNPMDMTVYDAACLSVVSELTEISNRLGGQAIDFPDFTRGYWKNWRSDNYVHL